MRVSWRVVLFVILCIVSILLVFTFIPILARRAHTTSDQIDILLHRENPPDYAIYLATITMGQSGKLFFRNYFSPAETKPLPIHSFYWLTGFLTAPFQLWQPYAYHLARILTVFAFALALYLLIRCIFSRPWQGAVAALTILLVPIMPELVYRQEVASSFMRWWIEFLHPINRLDPPPHHLAAQALFILALAWYLLYRKKRQLRFAVASAVTIIASVFLVPHTAIAYIIIVLVDAITSKTRLSIILVLVVFVAVGALSFSLRDTRWVANQAWEISYWGRDPYFYYHLYISFLPLVIFAIPAAYTGIRQKNPVRLMLFIWAITPLIVAPFTRMLGMGTGRLLQTGIHIPLALLSVFTLSDVLRDKKYYKVALWGICVLLLSSAAIQFPRYAASQWTTIARQPYTWWYYLPNNVYDMTRWIKTNLPADTRLIGVEGVGNAIVSFAPVIVYQGEQTHGYNWDLDLSSLWAFYGRRMSDAQAHSWLREQKITYVVDSVRVGWNTTDRPAYPFLTSIWENDGMRIYRVQ